jgi:ABC-type amino acid transport substrate-binding protein
MAVFGTPDKVEPIMITSNNVFTALSNHSIDVVTKLTTNTLSRAVYERDTQQGYTFSSTYFYDGLSFGGLPTYVECAENLESFSGPCRDLRICVVDASTIYTATHKLLPGTVLVTGKNYHDLKRMFLEGQCSCTVYEFNCDVVPIFI